MGEKEPNREMKPGDGRDPQAFGQAAIKAAKAEQAAKVAKGLGGTASRG